MEQTVLLSYQIILRLWNKLAYFYTKSFSDCEKSYPIII